MTREAREEAIGHIKDVICENNTIKPNIVVFEREKEALYIAIEALEQEDILDKIDEIITDALDKSTDPKESQTLRWVLDKISEVQNE